jgi:Ca2+-binding EF-hand superfamily protein
MPQVSSYEQAEGLWAEWNAAQSAQPASVPLHLLRKVFRQHGSFLAQHEIEVAFHAVGAVSDLTLARFLDCLIPLFGTSNLRARHAFGYLDPGTTGRVPIAALVRIIQAFAPDDPRRELIASEIDQDGDTWITLADMIAFLPSGAPKGRKPYRATHLDPARLGIATNETSSPRQPVAVGTKSEGVSSLQVRIGFFRLVQGAAYRSFRENYSANSETHLRARDLPYAMPDFVLFLRETVAYYLSLGIVEGKASTAEFHKLVQIVDHAVEGLNDRIKGWQTVPKTDAMLAAQASIDAARESRSDHRMLFASVIEFMLALRAQGIAPDALTPDVLAAHEVNRLRHVDLQTESQHPDAAWAIDAASYLQSWNRVILSDRDEQIDGAIMPVVFWYDMFMPQLLRCASITQDADLVRIDAENMADLDTWHAVQTANGTFDRHSTDLRDGFSRCNLPQKKSLAQAWALTEHYLNGLEKRREREDFGRGTGFLSQYVAFIDVFLGRNDVATSEMRLSFPYYIGPAVWCFLHTGAEIAEALPVAPRADAIDRFRNFFRAFTTMYPCPYCRYHLNRFVIQNLEVEYYPIEFLLLGRAEAQHNLAISLEDKLRTISAEAPGSLRLFLWKLHNAVSSSIARTEPWYHRDGRPLYTTRFWPSLDSELARAHALSLEYVDLDRLTDIYAIIKPAAALALLRDKMHHALLHNDTETFDEAASRAADDIVDLEAAVSASGLLSRHYRFDPLKTEVAPHFTAEEEAFARSGYFIEG